ncbi:MAG: GMC family oxidoreductase [Acidobacteriota bacterium]
MSEHYDLIAVGSSFATAFLLDGYLRRARPDARILVLERGTFDALDWQLEHKKSSSLQTGEEVRNDSGKRWVYVLAVGGASNGWWACTPRMMPNDFRLRSKYGVGVDWPLGYDDLEEHYSRAEEIMSVSGPTDCELFPRSRPFPQPPHRFSDPDKLLKAAYPDTYFQQASARARETTDTRFACCASSVCEFCPVAAKFTILGDMMRVFEDPRVTLETEATVTRIDTTGNVATGVRYRQDGMGKTAASDLVALGANALFNPFLLMRSGLDHPILGRHLHEQVSVYVTVELDGVDNFQGSTSITANGYMLYDGQHRSDYAAALIESHNIYFGKALRVERGKWRQRMELKFIFEDLPQEKNRLTLDDPDEEAPRVIYEGHSDYAQRGIDRLPEILPQLLSPLPIERIGIGGINDTESHIIGTTPMGDDPATSIVDRHLRHHEVRNLLVLGSSVYPTSSPTNPTLTLSALSLWAAAHL